MLSGGWSGPLLIRQFYNGLLINVTYPVNSHEKWFFANFGEKWPSYYYLSRIKDLQ